MPFQCVQVCLFRRSSGSVPSLGGQSLSASGLACHPLIANWTFSATLEDRAYEPGIYQSPVSGVFQDGYFFTSGPSEVTAMQSPRNSTSELGRGDIRLPTETCADALSLARLDNIDAAEGIAKDPHRKNTGNPTGISTKRTPSRTSQSIQVDSEITPRDASEEHDTIVEGTPLEDGPLEPLYSMLSERAKVSVILTASFAAIISPISSSIYFPALNSLAEDLDVSVSLITLTITTYLVSSKHPFLQKKTFPY